ncbi:aminoglycoside phosphotransferase family protein [Catellatospora tritici]|uniref:aminoglycoside phosphotransferase family protein n=1 Tax=Catellatospora tritici TaxID=2851566 RepID=UPI001C2DE590|nr:aminoglycoside phosphotransferase family protein [Catellatospora tritici]MBV1855108.1 aminoglycoside phosphotransferase family protein [Catellatospora tritici]
MAVVIPDGVRRTALERGEAGRAWLAGLPERLDRLRDRWALSFDEVYGNGTAALVLRVRTADRPAVLKLAAPGTGFGRQLRTLAAARGRGYVRLHAYDLSEHAALLEPLGSALAATRLPVPRRLDVLAETLHEAWQVPVRAEPGPGKAEQLSHLLQSLWARLGEPCSPELIAEALSAAADRAAAHRPEGSVVCHGDPHPGNALAVASPRPGAHTGYVLVDPAGVVAEPAYDLGVAVARTDPHRVLAAPAPADLVRADCARLAASCGVDPEAVWAWARTERVASGLYLLRFGHPALGRAYLAAAEAVRRDRRPASRPVTARRT